MAWVSYLEDIIERFTAELDGFKTKIDTTDESSIDHRKAAQALISQCRGLLSEVEGHLDLATDPSLDLAHENTSLKKQLKEIEIKKNSLEVTIKKLHLDILDRNKTIKERDNELKAVKMKYKKLSRDYEKSFNENPTGAYEHFSSEDRTKKYKGE